MYRPFNTWGHTCMLVGDLMIKRSCLWECGYVVTGVFKYNCRAYSIPIRPTLSEQSPSDTFASTRSLLSCHIWSFQCSLSPSLFNFHFDIYFDVSFGSSVCFRLFDSVPSYHTQPLSWNYVFSLYYLQLALLTAHIINRLYHLKFIWFTVHTTYSLACLLHAIPSSR